MSTIKIGVIGYGNLGKGVIRELANVRDMEPTALFTRRNPGSLDAPIPTFGMADLTAFVDRIDVMILCGGSATDLVEQGPLAANLFNTVDAFDNHKDIPAYFAAMDQAARAGGHLALIASGWDPGLFSLQRVLADSVLPNSTTTTFWGPGVSQGHSDAVRRVPGVEHAIQYTVPNEDAIARIEAGDDASELSVRDKHRRVCYVVAREGADHAQIEHSIKTMKNYFEPYDTDVHFISREELLRDHHAMPHGGQVICSGLSANNDHQVTSYKLKLASNPSFTASVLIATARAVYRLARDGKTGACSLLDVPIGYLSPHSPDELRANYL